MAPAPQTAPVTVRLQRTFQAPREKVFQAWTRPEDLRLMKISEAMHD